MAGYKSAFPLGMLLSLFSCSNLIFSHDLFIIILDGPQGSRRVISSQVICERILTDPATEYSQLLYVKLLTTLLVEEGCASCSFSQSPCRLEG